MSDLHYATVGISLTNKCTAKCSICCLNSTPESDEVINLEIVERYILSTKNITQIKAIGFSGGEVFLEYDKLKYLMQVASSVGKVSTIITNCLWATSYDIACEKVKELKECGLSNLGISYDEFHSKYIEIIKIKNVIRAAKDLGIPIEVQVVMTKNSNQEILLSKLGEDVAGLKLSFLPCFPAGRAKDNIKDEEYVRSFSSAHRYCAKSGIFDVDVKGNIWPCCSVSVQETILKLGNIKELDVKGSLKRIQNNRILYLLRNYGFDYFNKIAEEKLGMKVPEKVIHSCELCSLYFGKENYYRFLPYIYEETEKLVKQKATNS